MRYCLFCICPRTLTILVLMQFALFTICQPFFVLVQPCAVSDILPDILICEMECFNNDSHHECHRKHVIIAIWTIEFLQACVIKSMGVLLPVLLDQFAAHTRNIGVVVSYTIFCGTLVGKYSWGDQL